MRLVLETTHFLQMFSDKDFYASLPASLEPLRESMKQSYEKALDIALNRNKDKCGGCTTIRHALDDSINELGQQLKAAWQADPDLLLPFKNYLSTKLKKRVTQAVLYYKDAEKNNRVLNF
jgi:hypothetical protein